MKLFEAIAEVYNKKEKYMAWKTVVTNFPVIQVYRKPISDRTWLSYNDNKIHVVVENWEEATLDFSSQKLGASPNIVHSLDAAHMAMVLASAYYDIAPVHDSWGCSPGHMQNMFALIRKKFVELYEAQPLETILSQLGCSEMLPEKGNLDVSQVLDSDYCFC